MLVTIPYTAPTENSARSAISLMVAAWKPFSPNTSSAASRRCSRLHLEHLPAALLPRPENGGGFHQRYGHERILTQCSEIHFSEPWFTVINPFAKPS